VGRYTSRKCIDKCELIECPKCKHPTTYPEWYLLAHGGMCSYCNKNNFTFLDVPYERKDEARAMGAMFDGIKKKWYIFKHAKNKTTVLSKFREVK
jgi:hypothetical protein